MAGVVLLDQREQIYRGLVHATSEEMARKDPALFLRAIEFLADRFEGRPTQHVVAEHRRTTIFQPVAGAAPMAPSSIEASRMNPVADPVAGAAALALKAGEGARLPVEPMTIVPPPGA